MRNTDSSKKQAQVIVNLGDRSHGRTGISARGFLLYGYCRAQALDALYIRLFHLFKELARIGGQRLHVAALSLGVNCVESQAALAAAAQARDNYKLVPWYFQVNMLEIMLGSTFDYYFIDHDCCPALYMRNILN
jgi:hypothetical protein